MPKDNNQRQTQPITPPSPIDISVAQKEPTVLGESSAQAISAQQTPQSLFTTAVADPPSAETKVPKISESSVSVAQLQDPRATKELSDQFKKILESGCLKHSNLPSIVRDNQPNFQKEADQIYDFIDKKLNVNKLVESVLKRSLDVPIPNFFYYYLDTKQETVDFVDEMPHQTPLSPVDLEKLDVDDPHFSEKFSQIHQDSYLLTHDFEDHVFAIAHSPRFKQKHSFQLFDLFIETIEQEFLQASHTDELLDEASLVFSDPSQKKFNFCCVFDSHTPKIWDILQDQEFDAERVNKLFSFSAFDRKFYSFFKKNIEKIDKSLLNEAKDVFFKILQTRVDQQGDREELSIINSPFINFIDFKKLKELFVNNIHKRVAPNLLVALITHDSAGTPEAIDELQSALKLYEDVLGRSPDNDNLENLKNFKNILTENIQTMPDAIRSSFVASFLIPQNTQELFSDQFKVFTQRSVWMDIVNKNNQLENAEQHNQILLHAVKNCLQNLNKGEYKHDILDRYNARLGVDSIFNFFSQSKLPKESIFDLLKTIDSKNLTKPFDFEIFNFAAAINEHLSDKDFEDFFEKNDKMLLLFQVAVMKKQHEMFWRGDSPEKPVAVESVFDDPDAQQIGKSFLFSYDKIKNYFIGELGDNLNRLSFAKKIFLLSKTPKALVPFFCQVALSEEIDYFSNFSSFSEFNKLCHRFHDKNNFNYLFNIILGNCVQKYHTGFSPEQLEQLPPSLVQDPNSQVLLNFNNWCRNLTKTDYVKDFVFNKVIPSISRAYKTQSEVYPDELTSLSDYISDSAKKHLSDSTENLQYVIQKIFRKDDDGDSQLNVVPLLWLDWDYFIDHLPSPELRDSVLTALFLLFLKILNKRSVSEKFANFIYNKIIENPKTFLSTLNLVGPVFSTKKISYLLAINDIFSNLNFERHPEDEYQLYLDITQRFVEFAVHPNVALDFLNIFLQKTILLLQKAQLQHNDLPIILGAFGKILDFCDSFHPNFLFFYVPLFYKILGFFKISLKDVFATKKDFLKPTVLRSILSYSFLLSFHDQNLSSKYLQEWLSVINDQPKVFLDLLSNEKFCTTFVLLNKKLNIINNLSADNIFQLIEKLTNILSNTRKTQKYPKFLTNCLLQSFLQAIKRWFELLPTFFAQFDRSQQTEQLFYFLNLIFNAAKTTLNKNESWFKSVVNLLIDGLFKFLAHSNVSEEFILKYLYKLNELGSEQFNDFLSLPNILNAIKNIAQNKQNQSNPTALLCVMYYAWRRAIYSAAVNNQNDFFDEKTVELFLKSLQTVNFGENFNDRPNSNVVLLLLYSQFLIVAAKTAGIKTPRTQTAKLKTYLSKFFNLISNLVDYQTLIKQLTSEIDNTQNILSSAEKLEMFFVLKKTSLFDQKIYDGIDSFCLLLIRSFGVLLTAHHNTILSNEQLVLIDNVSNFLKNQPLLRDVKNLKKLVFYFDLFGFDRSFAICKKKAWQLLKDSAELNFLSVHLDNPKEIKDFVGVFIETIPVSVWHQLILKNLKNKQFRKFFKIFWLVQAYNDIYTQKDKESLKLFLTKNNFYKKLPLNFVLKIFQIYLKAISRVSADPKLKSEYLTDKFWGFFWDLLTAVDFSKDLPINFTALRVVNKVYDYFIKQAERLHFDRFLAFRCLTRLFLGHHTFFRSDAIFTDNNHLPGFWPIKLKLFDQIDISDQDIKKIEFYIISRGNKLSGWAVYSFLNRKVFSRLSANAQKVVVDCIIGLFDTKVIDIHLSGDPDQVGYDFEIIPSDDRGFFLLSFLEMIVGYYKSNNNLLSIDQIKHLYFVLIRYCINLFNELSASKFVRVHKALHSDDANSYKNIKNSFLKYCDRIKNIVKIFEQELFAALEKDNLKIDQNELFAEGNKPKLNFNFNFYHFFFSLFSVDLSFLLDLPLSAFLRSLGSQQSHGSLSHFEDVLNEKIKMFIQTSFDKNTVSIQLRHYDFFDKLTQEIKKYNLNFAPTDNFNAIIIMFLNDIEKFGLENQLFLTDLLFKNFFEFYKDVPTQIAFFFCLKSSVQSFVGAGKYSSDLGFKILSKYVRYLVNFLKSNLNARNAALLLHYNIFRLLSEKWLAGYLTNLQPSDELYDTITDLIACVYNGANLIFNQKIPLARQNILFSKLLNNIFYLLNSNLLTEKSIDKIFGLAQLIYQQLQKQPFTPRNLEHIDTLFYVFLLKDFQTNSLTVLDWTQKIMRLINNPSNQIKVFYKIYVNSIKWFVRTVDLGKINVFNAFELINKLQFYISDNAHRQHKIWLSHTNTLYLQQHNELLMLYPVQCFVMSPDKSYSSEFMPFNKFKVPPLESFSQHNFLRLFIRDKLQDSSFAAEFEKFYKRAVQQSERDIQNNNILSFLFLKNVYFKAAKSILTAEDIKKFNDLDDLVANKILNEFSDVKSFLKKIKDPNNHLIKSNYFILNSSKHLNKHLTTIFDQVAPKIKSYVKSAGAQIVQRWIKSLVINRHISYENFLKLFQISRVVNTPELDFTLNLKHGRKFAKEIAKERANDVAVAIKKPEALKNFIFNYNTSDEMIVAQRILPLLPPQGLNWVQLKKQYPAAEQFPFLKQIFSKNPNRPINAIDLHQVLLDRPLEKYDVSYTTWTGLQRHVSSNNVNLVIQLNLSDSLLYEKFSELEQKILLACLVDKTNGSFSYFNKEAGGDFLFIYSQARHPTMPYSLGWIRVHIVDHENWIIEELQSDFLKEFSDDRAVEILWDKLKQTPFYWRTENISFEQFVSLFKSLKAKLKFLYHKKLLLTIDLAKKNGVHNLYLHGSGLRSLLSNVDYVPPVFKEIYEEIPKMFNFKPIEYNKYPIFDRELFSDIKRKYPEPSPKFYCWLLKLKNK